MLALFPTVVNFNGLSLDLRQLLPLITSHLIENLANAVVPSLFHEKKKKKRTKTQLEFESPSAPFSISFSALQLNLSKRIVSTYCLQFLLSCTLLNLLQSASCLFLSIRFFFPRSPVSSMRPNLGNAKTEQFAVLVLPHLWAAFGLRIAFDINDHPFLLETLPSSTPRPSLLLTVFCLAGYLFPVVRVESGSALPW